MVNYTPATSRLDSCNAVYIELPLKTKQKLQLEQNVAIKLVMGGRTRPEFHHPFGYPISGHNSKVLNLTFKAVWVGIGMVEGPLFGPAIRVPACGDEATRDRAFSVAPFPFLLRHTWHDLLSFMHRLNPGF